MAVTVPVLPSGYKPHLVASGLWPKRRQLRPIYNARPVLHQIVTQWLRWKVVLRVVTGGSGNGSTRDICPYHVLARVPVLAQNCISGDCRMIDSSEE
jgi:hypothetical protein